MALSHQVAGLHATMMGSGPACPMIENRSRKRKFVFNVRHIPQSQKLDGFKPSSCGEFEELIRGMISSRSGNECARVAGQGR